MMEVSILHAWWITLSYVFVYLSTYLYTYVLTNVRSYTYMYTYTCSHKKLCMNCIRLLQLGIRIELGLSDSSKITITIDSCKLFTICNNYHDS